MSKKFLTPVVLPADPVAAMEAATKQYVDTKAPKPTGTPDGTKFFRDDNTWAAPPAGGGGLSQATADSLYVNVTGDTMTGTLTMPHDSPVYYGADARISGDYGTLRLWSRANGITANAPIDGQTPIAASHLTTKAYVDSKVGGPVGTISMWPVATPPAGYLICNGSTFSSVTYPDLATLLGDTYGTHSGTNYYLPDFRGRSPIGTGGPVPDDGSGYVFGLGQKFGESRHTQTVAEMPSHAHTQNVTNGGTQAGGPFWANGTTIVQWSNSAGSSGVPTVYNGGGSPANVTHTILGINFIIRAVQSADPSISGAASYTAPVPAMTAGTWLNITHSLGTEDVGVWVKEAASKENVNVDWKVVDLNTVALRSHSDVAANFLTAVVKK